MKTTIFFLTLFISAMIMGCSDQNTKSTPLEVGVATEVKSGDIYNALSDDALVTYEQNLTTNTRTITLTQGKGEIVSIIK